MQVNYTYVHQSGINNSNLIDSLGRRRGRGGSGIREWRPAMSSTRTGCRHFHAHLQRGRTVREGPLGIRLAYNWRSRYLTQNLDCCIGLPVFQKAAGFLDGSVRYSIDPLIELSVDVSNILAPRVYQQEIFGDSPLTPGAKPVYMDSAWSRVDRRFQFGVRAKF